MSVAISFGRHKIVGASKPIFNRKSKQELVEKKMKFGIKKGSSSVKGSRKHTGGISPSVDSFEKMLKMGAK